MQCAACSNTFTAPHDDPLAHAALPLADSSSAAPAPSEDDYSADRPIPRPQPTLPREELALDEPREETLSPFALWSKNDLKLQGLSSEYRIDLGQWFSYAGEHYSVVIGPAAGYMLLYGLMLLLSFVIPCLGFLFHLFLAPALQAGLTVVYLAQLKGQPWSFADFFAGFHWYGALLGNYFLTSLISLGCLLPFLVLGAIIQDQPRLPNRLLWLLGGGGILVLLCGYILIRATCFNVLLIIDRNCNPMEAIRGSWQLSDGHFVELAAVWLVLSLLTGVGLLLLGIGFFVTMPLASLVYTSGYLLIAGSRPPKRFVETLRADQPEKLFLEEL